MGVSALEAFPADEDLDVAIRNFMSWFQEHYGAPLKVKLAPAGQGMRMGVFATEAIQAEEKYLSIPLDLTINPRTMERTATIGPIVKSLRSKVNRRSTGVGAPETQLMVFLIYEKFVNRESFWKPYLDLLPTELDTPEFYADEELKWLNGTGIAEKVRDIRRNRAESYQWFLRDVRTGHEDELPLWAFTNEHWSWAGGITGTRMIWWDGAPHLVPMLDMINCRQGPEGFERRVHQTVREGTRAVTKAPWDFQVGDQIFENYGQPNPTYMLYHGFVIHPNVHDCVHLRPNPKSFSPARLQKLRQLRLYADEYCLGPGRWNELFAVARLLAMDQKEFDEMVGNGLSAERVKRPVSRRTDRAAITNMLKLLKGAVLDKLPQRPFSVPAEQSGRKEMDVWLNNVLPAEAKGYRERVARTFVELQRQVLIDMMIEINEWKSPLTYPGETRPPVDDKEVIANRRKRREKSKSNPTDEL